MSADNPVAGTPAEAARSVAALRVELATEASKSLTKIVDDMCPWEIGFSEAIAVDALEKTLRAQVPR